jgi:L-methionine (R)-S-oxide reductase
VKVLRNASGIGFIAYVGVFTMSRGEIFETLSGEIMAIADGDAAPREKLECMCELFRSSIPGYDWVGFYLIDPSARDELVLGPYAGAPTDHLRIPFGKGICGRAASELETIVVDDVSAESNYLSCSIDVKSEIVVPIIKDGKLLGEIDIDSHVIDAFDDEDRAFLGVICEITAGFVENIIMEA